MAGNFLLLYFYFALQHVNIGVARIILRRLLLTGPSRRRVLGGGGGREGNSASFAKIKILITPGVINSHLPLISYDFNG